MTYTTCRTAGWSGDRTEGRSAGFVYGLSAYTSRVYRASAAAVGTGMIETDPVMTSPMYL